MVLGSSACVHLLVAASGFMTKKIKKCYTLQSQLKHGNSEKWITMPSHSFMGRQFALGVWSMVKSQYGGNLRYRMIESDSGVVVETWQCPNAGVHVASDKRRVGIELIKTLDQRGDIRQDPADEWWFFQSDDKLGPLSPSQLRIIADELDERNKENKS